MSNITRTTGTYTAHTNAAAADVEADVSTLYNAHNNHDAGTSKWTVVSTLNATATPLIADNSTGTNNIAEFKDNGTANVTIADGGVTTFAPGGTTKAVVNSSGITMSNSATIAMGAAKITGLANGTASTDAAAFGQLKYFQAPVLFSNNTTTATSSSSFVDTIITATITPTSASSRVKMTFSTTLSGSAAGNTVTLVYLTNGSNGFGANGIYQYTGAITSNMPFTYSDVISPATTSAVTIKVQVKISSGATVTVGSGIWSTMILEEVA